MIVWLEDVKVRFLAMEDRMPLRAVSSPEWDATLKSVSAHFGSLMLKYLSELQCPHTAVDLSEVASRDLVLNWLIGYAAALVYEDNSNSD